MSGNSLRAVANNIRVIRFEGIESPVYDAQYNRPWDTSITSVHTVNTVRERLENIGNNIGTIRHALSDISSEIIAPSSNTERSLIVNGWDCRRIQFILTISYEDSFSNINYETITGYTDHVGVTRSMQLDENMMFTVNNILSEKEHRGQRGVVYETRWNNQMLNAPVDRGGRSFENSSFVMRPEDICLATSLPATYDESQPLTSMITARGVINNRLYNDSSSYLSHALSSIKKTMADARTNTGEQEVLLNSSSLLKSNNIRSSVFLRKMQESSGLSVSTMEFTFAKLLRVFPEIRSIARIDVLPDADRSNTNYIGQASSTNGSDTTAIYANMVYHTTASYMAEHALSKVHFIATNENMSRTHGIDPLFDLTFAGSNHPNDNRDMIDSFIQKMTTVFLISLSRANEYQYWMEVDIEFGRTAIINISIERHEEERYVFPSFADALFTPIRTDSLDHFRDVSRDIGTLMQYGTELAETKSSYLIDKEEAEANGLDEGSIFGNDNLDTYIQPSSRSVGLDALSASRSSQPRGRDRGNNNQRDSSSGRVDLSVLGTSRSR